MPNVIGFKAGWAFLTTSNEEPVLLRDSDLQLVSITDVGDGGMHTDPETSVPEHFRRYLSDLPVAVLSPHPGETGALYLHRIRTSVSELKPQPALVFLAVHGTSEGALRFADLTISPESIDELLGVGAKLPSDSIVLLLACHSCGTVPEFGQKWADNLLNKGASVVIAPMGLVPTSMASFFLRRLLELFHDNGFSLLAAFSEVQKELRNEHFNPYGLFYGYYGNPSVRFARGLASSEISDRKNAEVETVCGRN